MKISDSSAVLQSFRDLAATQDTGVVQLTKTDGGNILGVGRTDGHREVQWVTSTGDPQADAALDLFMQALNDRYGSHIQSSVAHELGLSNGVALESRHVSVALEMAENHLGVYAGIHFMMRLDHSAQTDSPGFRSTLEALGYSSALLSSEDRQRIDERFTALHAAHADGDRQQVSQAMCTTLLEQAIRECLAR
jgi:hypothetical protein